MSKILIISSTSGNNLNLVKSIDVLIDRKAYEVELINLENLELPLYTPPAEKHSIPEQAISLSEKFRKCDGMIIAAPEYNGSIPPVLTNAIAWISRAGDKDWRAGFNQKIVQLASHSGSGGFKLLLALRMQLVHLGATVMAREILVNSSKPFNQDSAKDCLGAFLKLLGK